MKERLRKRFVIVFTLGLTLGWADATIGVGLWELAATAIHFVLSSGLGSLLGQAKIPHPAGVM